MAGGETSAAAMILAGINRWLDKVRPAVMSPWDRYRLTPNPVAIYAGGPQWLSEVGRFVTSMATFQRDGWRAANITDDDFAPRAYIALEQIAQSSNLLANIPAEVYGRLNTIITRNIAAGAPLGETAKDITAMLTPGQLSLWPNRAAVIARTETHRAVQAGIFAAGLHAQSVRRETISKTWIAHDDDSTRPEHRAADGQRVPVQAMFAVGNDALRFPLDPFASAGEVVNCRCRMTLSIGP